MRAVTPTLLQQALLGSLSTLLIATSTVLLRRRRLAFANAMLWVGMGTLGIIGALALPFVNTIGALIGVLPAAVFAGVASILLGTIAFILALQASRLERGLQDTSEAVGIKSVHPELRPASDDDVLALVPAYNEVRSIDAVVSSLRRLGLQVLVVDDGSSDGTGAQARRSGASVLALPTNLGVGGALRAGLRYARTQGFSAVVQCDGDGQHPAAAVQALLEGRATGIDLLIGSRFTRGFASVQGLARRSAIRALARSASGAVGHPITDSTSGLRIIQEPLLSELAETMPPHYLGDTFEVVYAAGRAGYEVRELPVEMVARQHGSSTATAATAAKMTLRAIITAGLRVHQTLRPRSSLS